MRDRTSESTEKPDSKSRGPFIAEKYESVGEISTQELSAQIAKLAETKRMPKPRGRNAPGWLVDGYEGDRSEG